MLHLLDNPAGDYLIWQYGTAQIDGINGEVDANYYYGDFETYWFKKETIKILPESQKQISTHDLTKKYCVNCGKKIKSEFKFCPSCGAKQD